MKKIATSPDRNTFQLENYVKRQEEKGALPSPEYIQMWENWREEAKRCELDPEWQRNNLEYDLRTCEPMLAKVRASDSYAQNLYAAMCNMEFIKTRFDEDCPKDTIDLLKGDRWSASWRSAGGIVANMRGKGDYIDWYCSGIGSKEDGYGLDKRRANDYVPEGTVTEEIAADLQQLGWIAVEWEDDK